MRIGNEFAENPLQYSPQVRKRTRDCLPWSLDTGASCPVLSLGENPTERGVHVRGGVQAQLILPHPGWNRAQGVGGRSGV